MDDDSLIDDQSLDLDFYEEVKRKNKTYVLWVLFLIVVIAILYPMSRIDDTHSILEQFVDSFIFSIVVNPFLAVIIAVPASFLPYKGLFLHQKYKRTFLLTLISLNIAFILLLLLIISYTFYEYLTQ